MRLIDADLLEDAIDEVDLYSVRNGKLISGAGEDDEQLFKAYEIYKALKKAPSFTCENCEWYEKHWCGLMKMYPPTGYFCGNLWQRKVKK